MYFLGTSEWSLATTPAVECGGSPVREVPWLGGQPLPPPTWEMVSQPLPADGRDWPPSPGDGCGHPPPLTSRPLRYIPCFPAFLFFFLFWFAAAVAGAPELPWRT